LEAKQRESEKEEKFDMLADLEKIAEENPDVKQEEQEGSDFAPVSPYADMPSVEEEKRKVED